MKVNLKNEIMQMIPSVWSMGMLVHSHLPRSLSPSVCVCVCVLLTSSLSVLMSFCAATAAAAAGMGTLWLLVTSTGPLGKMSADIMPGDIGPR